MGVHCTIWENASSLAGSGSQIEGNISKEGENEMKLKTTRKYCASKNQKYKAIMNIAHERQIEPHLWHSEPLT